MKQEDSADRRSWYATSLGQSLVQAERKRLAALLPGLYGPIAVQVSRHGYPDMLETSEAVAHIFVDDDSESLHAAKVSAVAEALPFDTKSVGLVVLPHVLEVSDDPHQILREASRVLVPEGHVVLLGFNPLSLWGIRHVIAQRRDSGPWNGRYYRLSRVKDWLEVLGFEIGAGAMAYYRPPAFSEPLNRRLAFLEKAGERWWPMMAGVYILVARKREVGITPIVPSWKRQNRLAPGLAEPVARTANRAAGQHLH